MKKALFTVIGIAFIISAFAQQQARQLQFREETFDFGAVAENEGPVTHEFVFTNNSPRPVRILTVQASCGCTTPGWSKEPVEPGRTGYIQASFNPKGRPGFFNKSLTVTTDLEANPMILQIKGQVSNDSKPNEAEFQIVNGGLKLKGSSFNMGKVFIRDEFVVREFPILNSIEKPITFTGKFVSPNYIKVSAEPRVLQPGEKGVIRISYNGKLKNQYGFQSDNVELHTDDEVNPVKSFSVYATLEDYFPELTPDESAKAPQLRLSAYTVDFGRIKSRTPAVKEVQITNTGKKELNVRSLQGNCTCITATASKSTLKPGDSSTIRVAFDPQERTGTQQKAVTIYSNDPKNPVQRVTFTAYIE